MPGRVSTPSDPSLEPEDWQQIWRRLKKLCLVTQRANSRLIFVTARPDDIFGDAVTFARYKDDIYRRKRYLDIESFSSFVSISDVTHPASQSTELRIQWGACLLHLNQSESEGRNTRSRVSTRSSSSSYARSVRIAAASSGPSGGNRYGCGDQCATEDMDELWKYVRGEPDQADIKRSWECKGVLKAVDQFLEATFNQTVEQCALCTEVGFQVVPHRLGGFRQPQTLVCDGCIDSKSPRRVVCDGKEINKLRGRP